MIEQLGQVNRLAMGINKERAEIVQEQYKAAYEYQEKQDK